MDDLDRIIILTEEIALLKNRYEENSGKGNINTAISVLQERVEELKKKIRYASAGMLNKIATPMMTGIKLK